MNVSKDLKVTPLGVTLVIIALATPFLAVMIGSAIEARQLRGQTSQLTSLLQANLSHRVENEGVRHLGGLDPALSQHLELVHRSASRHHLRLENLYREGPTSQAIRLGLGGAFWETNAFLRDLEHAGFGLHEIDLSSEDGSETTPTVQSRILIETPIRAVQDTLTDHVEETPYWRNPFSRLRPHRVEVKGKFFWGLNSVHSLTGIASINGIETATIDGRDFVEGEVLGGRKITRIETDRVWLADEVREFVLEFRATAPAG